MRNMNDTTGTPVTVNTVLDLCGAARCGLFADRDTISEAWDYAMRVGKATGTEAQMVTVAGVMLNTVLKVVQQVYRDEKA